MKKFLLLFGIAFIPFLSQAQNLSEQQILNDFLDANQGELLVETADLGEFIITDSYVSKHNGVRHIYLNQAYEGIPIHNAILNLNVHENKVVHYGNRLINNLQTRISQTSPSIDIHKALNIQFEKMGIVTNEKPVLFKKLHDHNYRFDAMSFTEGQIEAELKYYPIDESLELIYEIRTLEKSNPHFWNTKINALTGDIIEHRDATLYCSFHDDAFHNHNANCRHDAPASVIPPMSPVAGSYLVYPLPAESPIHGQAELVTDPHYLEASPYGWHDIDGVEGPEFTITRGNNVHAFRDGDDTGVSMGDEPDGGADLIFDFPHDDSIDPDLQREADITNLFYMNNMMHDLAYLFGFDEASGNFQNNNYGNGGAAGDFVRAQGQDGGNLLDADHTNNANFSTPSDGSSGRMQMYLWNQSGGSTFIVEPAEIAGGLEVGVPSGDGWGFIYATQFSQVDITAQVVVADDGTLGNPARACNPLENDGNIQDKIAMIDRGICEFGTKAFNAQNAGAVAALICNVPGVNGGDGDELVNMQGGVDGASVTIPALFVKHSDCEIIRASLNAGVDVIMKINQEEDSGPAYRSSSFDNGVIAHEYGHGISTRLTGGPSNSGCLPFANNLGEQMGEGWSDFFSLITTVEPGDLGSDVRGIGNYVDGLNRESRGIRRFPYSTDMSVNPQTMDDIAGQGVHGIGEIWAGVLWDMYWAFVDLYGYDADWRNTESGNFKAVQLVMDGMKFQPCAPGFVDGRDAIMLADQVNYSGENQCMIWDVFARRGIGTNSDQGSSASQNDNVSGFESEPTCIKELKIKKEITGVLIPGEETEVVLTFANHTESTTTNVTISDEIPENSVFVSHDSNFGFDVQGNTVVFEIGDLESLTEDTIRYIIQSDADINSTIIYAEDNEDQDLLDQNWDREIIQGLNFWQVAGFEDFAYSGFNSWFIAELDEATQSNLIYKDLEVVGTKPVLRFWHMFNTAQTINGGFIEVSTDGIIWEDVKDRFIRNPYPTTLNYGTFAIPALEGFTGNSNGYIDSHIDLSDFVGETISLRFRFGTDETGNLFAPDNGWFVDDFELLDLIEYKTEACINSDNESGCSGVKQSIVEAMMTETSTEDLTNNGVAMSVFPNPANDYISIVTNSNYAFEGLININTLDGRLIQSQKISVNRGESVRSIDTSIYPAGMYILQIQSDGGFITKKIVIN